MQQPGLKNDKVARSSPKLRGINQLPFALHSVCSIRQEAAHSVLYTCVPQPHTPEQIPPITSCLTVLAVIGRSVGHRGSQLHLLAKMLSHLFEPRPRVGAVDDASQEPQAFAGVVPIAPDILFSNFCI